MGAEIYRELSIAELAFCTRQQVHQGCRVLVQPRKHACMRGRYFIG